MNLRDQLKEILPDILPRNPAQSIKGTELIEMVKYKLRQEYSDATLRYHFSIMSCDPSSPIAKVEHGQGYYLRSTTIHSLNSARNLISQGQGSTGGEFALSSEDANVSLSRANKFRAVAQRYFESLQQFPFAFERSFSVEEAGANRWRYPDMAVVDWTVGERVDDETFQLDPEQCEVHRRLGSAPFRVSSVKLRLELNPFTVREDLYQCLATSGWANTGEILIAAPISDLSLLQEIRQFAARHGVGVTTFGLEADVLDDMPEPAAIQNLLPREFDAIQSLFNLRRLSAPVERTVFDWQQVTEAATDNPDFDSFQRWISRCLIEEKVLPAREFIESGSQSEEPKEERKEAVA
ncbi:MAG: hypothetical protein HKN23_11980 [Verrucomicrobiales bacterium]|nr:hypothetical protein [Verrucomicrobiales bacterium]